MENAKRDFLSLFEGITLPGWAILPLRFFLAFSFLAAGWDKLSDPTFLDPSARGYIGNQIAGFAPGTPLEGFLLNFAQPNATLFGVMTMGGEICIGLAVLLGLLTRFSAAMGLLLNLTFFLSATWDIHPFYFGADLPYCACWLTLLLAGPGPLALDIYVKRWLTPTPPHRVVKGRSAPFTNNARLTTRRTFLGMGVAAFAGAVFATTGIGWGIAHGRKAEALASLSGQSTPTVTLQPTMAVAPTATATETPVPTKSAPTEQPTSSTGASDTPVAAQDTATPVSTDTPAPQPTTPPTSEAAGKQLIAAAGTLPIGQGIEFNLPTGEPAVLVHNDAGYSAYVMICTHEGCVVQPTSSGTLRCPCHGSVFDLSAGAQPLNGPARRPLSSVALTVDAKGNVYLAG